MADGGDGRDALTPVVITVFNQSYRVVSVDGGERAEAAARIVDERMREVSSRITTHDVAKIAVMAALNIADDLLTLSEQRAQPHAGAPPAETAPEPAEAPAAADDDAKLAPARISWYESVFDDELGTPQSRRDRMSNQITERLATRQTGARRPDRTDDKPSE
jgi:cell division protein ZapA (FtsZ GTPase activity inhibitor)